MEAKELRLGNLVMFKQDGLTKNKEPQKVLLICDDGVILHKYSYPYRQIQGIPLTEEWLIKFGFEQQEDYYVIVLGYDFGEVKIYPSPNGFFFMEGVIQQQIEYVHQLQNLVYCLGEELTINQY